MFSNLTSSARRCSSLKNLLFKSLPIFSPPSAQCSWTASEAFVTSFSNPGDLTLNDVGFYYRGKNQIFLNTLFKNLGMEPSFVEECKTFNETPILVRKPTLELIHYLKNANYDQPVNKYLIYGKFGNGVSFTSLQAVYYAYLSEWMIVHLPWVLWWSKKKSELVESRTMKGYIDTPNSASIWLDYFKSQNEALIKKLDLKLVNNYTWNIQEKHEKGESLMNLIDFGIMRSKYACDVIMALVEELKQCSREGRIRTLVVIDGFSWFFCPFKKPKNKKVKCAAPYKISCLQSLKSFAKADWHNGAVVVTCAADPKNNSNTDFLPLNQLKREGFEFLHPFVSIEVPKLTEKEMDSVLTYYRSQKWLLRSDIDEEIKVLCDGNFATLRLICSSV